MSLCKLKETMSARFHEVEVLFNTFTSMHFRSIDSKLDSTNKGIKEEEQRVNELTTNIKTTIENMEAILFKTKQIEVDIEQIKVNSDALSDELNR